METFNIMTDLLLYWGILIIVLVQFFLNADFI